MTQTHARYASFIRFLSPPASDTAAANPAGMNETTMARALFAVQSILVRSQFSMPLYTCYTAARYLRRIIAGCFMSYSRPRS